MSKADKMFEELGYKKQAGLREINYFFGNDEIIFYKDVKWFSCSKLEEIDFINMQELKAINQKCKELRVDIMCKYCKTPPGVEVVCSLTARGTYNAFNENKEEWHKVKYSTEICFNKKMNYCPMCGRKLGG